MISIVICSRTPRLSDYLNENISYSIGVTYELIVVDNSDKVLSIFEAYNIGVNQAKYPYVCFMHDDIKYHSNNWGQKIISYFDDVQTGAIAIAGSPYASIMPGAWWLSKMMNINIIPWDAVNKQPQLKQCKGIPGEKNEIVLFDGVWFCIRKKLFNHLQFDQTVFKGFHFYDIDISLQINKLGYKSFCVFDILIEHFSKGDMNVNWVENALLLNKKWNKELPISCTNFSLKNKWMAELNTIRNFVSVMLVNKFSPEKVYKQAFMTMFKFPLGFMYFPFIKLNIKYFIKSILQAVKNVR